MDPLTVNLIVSLSWPIVVLFALLLIYKLAPKMQDRHFKYKELKATAKSSPPPALVISHPSAGATSGPISDWRIEWSRHYDQIHWISNTIFIGGIGALLVYSYQKPSPFIMFLGLWLSWFTLYYSASFRNMRDILHNGMPNGDERNFLLDINHERILHQWPVYLITYGILIFGWILQFWKINERSAIVLGILSIVVVTLICKLGKQWPFKR